MLLWISIGISLDFYGYPCIDLLWILDPGVAGKHQKLTPVLGMKVKQQGEERNLVIFKDTCMYNHINSEL